MLDARRVARHVEDGVVERDLRRRGDRAGRGERDAALLRRIVTSMVPCGTPSSLLAQLDLIREEERREVDGDVAEWVVEREEVVIVQRDHHRTFEEGGERALVRSRRLVPLGLSRLLLDPRARSASCHGR